MTSYSKGDVSATFTYDADGLRGSKTVNGSKTTYFYVGDQLMYECRGDGIELYFYYDSYGNLSAIRYVNGTNSYYYYVTTNSQGDVLGIYSAAGDLKASYEYDTWGNCTIVSDTSGINIATVNPIRYRGYYYDNDLGLYYLQSRYYDSTIGRFINADGALNGNGDILGYNMFAYCSNNPVTGYDPYGYFDIGSLIDFGVNVISGAIAIGAGFVEATITLLTTGDVVKATCDFVTTTLSTFGSINNTVNTVYYNYISDGKSDIDESGERSAYVEKYVNRWERLDYTKQQTKSSHYNANAWRYHSEYSVHMYGWYATSWAKGKNIPIISAWALNFEKLDINQYSWDKRGYVNVGIAIWGALGL